MNKLAITAKDVAIYPIELLHREENLVHRFREEKKNPNIRVKLVLIAEALSVLAEKETIDCAIKVKALAGHMASQMRHKRLT